MTSDPIFMAPQPSPNPQTPREEFEEGVPPQAPCLGYLSKLYFKVIYLKTLSKDHCSWYAIYKFEEVRLSTGLNVMQ